MSDPDRRHSSGASDYDAIFADIVAHLNDDLTEAEQPVRRAPDVTDPEADPDTDAAAAGSPGADAPADSVAGQVDQLDQKDRVGQENDPAKGQTGDPARGQTSESVDPQDAGVSPGERDPWSMPLPLPPFQPRQEDRDPLKDEEPGPVPQVWRAHEVEDYEDHFEPPPANPLPAGDLQFWAIIAGMGGGPLLLLYLVFFNRDASSYWILTAIALCVGGFALLVSRMPGNHEDDDDGARV
jgi:hypothetical protein